MKNKIIILMAIMSFSSFAHSKSNFQSKCEQIAYEDLISTEIVGNRLEILLKDTQSNLEEVSEIGKKARELAQIACNDHPYGN